MLYWVMIRPDPARFKAFRWTLALATTLSGVLGGCGERASKGSPPDTPFVPAPISIEELRAAEYPADLLDRTMVRLVAGVFTPPDSGRDAIASLELHPMVAIPEPAEGLARAAAIIMESGGGTGMFYWLHLLERTEGAPRVVASAYLGDRVEIVNLALAGDTVVVRLVTQGPTDAFCCPTLEVTRRYVRSGRELGEVRSEK